MGICLGNLTIAELEKRTGWTFSAEDKKWLADHRQDNVDISPYKEEFHIFDVPFLIEVSEPVKSKVTNMLKKYNDKQISKEPLQIGFRIESDKEKAEREKKEAEEKERIIRNENPNSVWNIKWHMLIPIKAVYNSRTYDLYFSCFINTYTKGRANIPDIIDGIIVVSKDERGLHGNFTLYNPEINNDANANPDCNWVIGNCLYDLKGNYFGLSLKDITFEEVRFSIKEAIELYKSIKGEDSKEIHFDRILNI